MNVRLLPAAERDVRTVRDHLGEVDPRLSVRFAEDVDLVLERLVVFPRSAPRVDGRPDVRRALLHDFPHAVYYVTTAHEIVVLRILHTSRERRP